MVPLFVCVMFSCGFGFGLVLVLFRWCVVLLRLVVWAVWCPWCVLCVCCSV